MIRQPAAPAWPGTDWRAAAFAVVTAGASPALAQTIPYDPVVPGSTAEKVVPPLIEAIDRFYDANPLFPLITVQSPVTAIDQGDAVIVTFPGVIFDIVDLSGQDSLAMGDISFLAKPLDGGRVRFESRLPATIEARDDSGIVGTVSIGSSAIEGEWWPELLTFGKLEAELAILSVVDAQNGAELVGVDSLTISTLVDEAAPVGADITSLVALEGLAVTPPSEPSISLGAFRQRASMTAVDLDRLRAFYQEFDLTPGAMPTDDLMLGIVELYRDLAWDELNFSLSVEDFAVEQFGDPMGGFGQLDVAFGATAGDEAGAAGISLSLAEPRDLAAMDLPLKPGFVPGLIAAAVSVDELPWRRILDAFAQNLGQRVEGRFPPDVDPRMLLDWMAEAGTMITLEELVLETPTIGVTGDGAFSVDPMAVFSVAGQADFLLYGVDAAMALLDQPTTSEDIGLVGVLTMLKGMGTPALDDGPDSFSYELRVTPEGSILVNGLPMEALMGAGAPR